MPVLVSSNFDDDSIRNEQASMESPFSHYKSISHSNLISKKHINGPREPEARNRTLSSFYACPGYQQL